MRRASAFLKKEGVNDPAKELALAIAISPLREEDLGKLKGDPDVISGIPADEDEGRALIEDMGVKVRNESGYAKEWKSLRRLSKAEAKAAGFDVSKVNVEAKAEPAKIEPAKVDWLAEVKEILGPLAEAFRNANQAAKPARARARARA
jgi:hypothetical protein